MTFEEFREQVRGQILSYLPEEYAEADVMLREVTKNNDQKLYALCIKRPEDRAVPSIYLDDFYQSHQEGWGMDKILESVSQTHLQCMAESTRWQDFQMGDYDSIKESLYVAVLNRDNNREYLEDAVRKDIPGTDITAVLRIRCGGQEEGNASYMVKESMPEMWGVTGEDMYEQALKNMERISPPIMLKLENILYLDEDDSILSKKLEPYTQYILSNDARSYGAAAMLYPGLLQEIGEATGDSFFILPSSIHEVILLKDNGEMDAGELQRMVIEINRSQVRPDEVLSDEVYSYDYREQKLTMATDPTQTKEYIGQMAAECGYGDPMEEAESEEMER